MTKDKNAITFQVLKIVEGTSVDGPGLRTSIYLAGCRHHCHGCHNPQSWDPEGGNTMTVAEILTVIKTNDAPVTFTGGDPLYDPEKFAVLLQCLRDDNPKVNIWCYTGFTWEQIYNDKTLLDAARHLDVIVDSPFILDLRDTTLLFRGSGNQRIIDVQATLNADNPVIPVLWEQPVWS